MNRNNSTSAMEYLVSNEARRQAAFPVAGHGVFLSHAAVAPLPQTAVDAMAEFARQGSCGAQENEWVWNRVQNARETSARLLGCTADEIALLGPTALGLSLVAGGMPWKTGDEVAYYADDYPANVYPWTALAERGVRPVALQPEQPGVITWEAVEKALTPRTRLVALATCNFLSGFRIDVDAIGKRLHERGILLCLDGIQSLGAFPLSVEHVDFLSADSHKWMLGPAGAGIVYVRKEHHDFLRPILLGSWNVFSPDFIAQDHIHYYSGARRYEPGMLNMPGIIGMQASLELLLDIGINAISERILFLRRKLLKLLRPLGYRLSIEQRDCTPASSDAERSGIISVTHPTRDLRALAKHLRENNIAITIRQNRAGEPFIRIAPHFYNTEEELAHTAALMS